MGSTDETDGTAQTDETDAPLPAGIAALVRSTCEPSADRASVAFSHQAVGDSVEGPWTGYVGSGAGVGDLDGDGVAELILPGPGPLTVWSRSGDDWTQRAASAGLLAATDALGVWPVDVDQDGDLDLHVLRFAAADRLLENDGTGAFSERVGTGVEGSSERSTTTSWGDLDGDGDLDLVVGAYGEDPIEDQLRGAPGPTRLLLQGPAWQFTDVAAAYGADFQKGWTYHTAIADLNGDGRLDVLSLRDFGIYFQRNRVLWGTAEGFRVGDLTSGLETRSSAMGGALGDVNGDGLLDVGISGFAEAQLLSLRGDRWFEVGSTMGFAGDRSRDQAVSWGVLLEDLDHDTRVDLVATFGPWFEQDGHHPTFRDDVGTFNFLGQPDLLALQNAEGRFEDHAVAVGFGEPAPTRGLVVDDLDHDGWLDLVVREIGGPAHVYRADCGPASSVTVRPAASVPASLAAGARVRVTRGGTTQTRWWTIGGQGCCSGGTMLAHVGVGGLQGPVRVEVLWRDGEVSVIEHDDLVGAVIWVQRDGVSP